MDKIEQFIENFKKGFDKKYLENVFLNGNCFHFALILEGMFENAEIIYDLDLNHFLTDINGKIYDITGRTERPLNWESWETISENEDGEWSELIKDCVYKV